MMKSYDMKRTWAGTGSDVRYYVNGVRVTRDAYETISTRARMYGKQDCFTGRACNRYGRSESAYFAMA